VTLDGQLAVYGSVDRSTQDPRTALPLPLEK